MFLFALMIAVLAYLIGSISAAVLVSKKMNLPDPKTYGSGNPGATNVLRSGNKKAAAFTLLGDAFKGLLAIGLARCLTTWLGLPDYTVGLAAIGVVLGHMYPLFFGFKGGKGVATGFGAVGVPVITLAKEVFGSEVTAQQTQALAGNVIFQLFALMFLVPFVILLLTDTSKKYIVPNIMLAAVVGGLSLAVQFCAAYFIGAETPAILGSISCIVFIVLYAKMTEKKDPDAKPLTLGQMGKAWAVYGFILVFILLASPLSGPISAFLKTTLVSKIHLPIYAEGKTFNFGWLSNAGLMLFLGAFIGGLVQGVSAGKQFQILGATLKKMKASGITIISLVAMSAIMSHSSMIVVIADGLVNATGNFYPLFAPLVGAIGTFATGSDTSSNILFGKLQAAVADKIGVNKAWLAAANTAGATGGKIISPQSIAIAAAACEQQGQEGAFLRSAMPYAAAYVLIAGITVYCFAALAL